MIQTIRQYDGDMRIEADGEILGWVRKHTGIRFTALRHHADDDRPVRSRHTTHARAVARVIESRWPNSLPN